jgi:predicted Zn-dependent protease
MLKRLWLLVILTLVGLVIQACGSKSGSPQASCDFVQNADQQRVSWGSHTPVVLYVDRSVPAAYYDTMVSAAQTWNQTIGHEAIRIGGWVDTTGAPAQDGQNVIYYMPTWESNRANEQARTTIYWSGDRIYEADVRINHHNFEFSATADAQAGEVDLQSLMVHEFGHVLGLEHTTTPQSVMVPSLPSATLRRSLAAFDQNSIRCEY